MTKKKKSLEEISASVKRYYDTITEEERAENLAWGEFAASQLAQTNWQGEDVPWAEPQQDDSEQGG